MTALGGSRRAALALATLLAVVGCAVPPKGPQPTPWTSGRLSLRVEAGPVRPAQALSAAFELRGTGEEGELRLLSPLGTRVAAALWGPGRASLQSGSGERQFASLDDLAQQALGEPLPLAALPDWLAGRPWPRAPFRGTPKGFEQLGWQVDTSARTEGLVTAARESPPAVQLRVRLDPPGT